MAAVACTLATNGLVAKLLPHISAGTYYATAENGWVDMVLPHFADWLRIPTQRLRELNDLDYGRSLQIGQTIRLDFSRVDATAFLEKRMEFHKGIEEDFLSSYRVAGTVEHTLRRGESIWELSHKTYRVPTWLIRRYNPETDLTKLSPGERLKIPVIESL